MEKIELAYIAGLFDGEGYVGVIKVKPNPKWRQKSPVYSMVVSIANTNLEILCWLRGLFGGSVFTTNKRTEHWQKGHEWRIVSNQAIPFLEAIQPYTKIKKEQIELALFFQRIKGHKSGGRKPLSESSLDLYEAIKIELEGMKKYAEFTETTGSEKEQHTQGEPVPKSQQTPDKTEEKAKED